MSGLEAGVLLSDIVQQLRRENADVPDLYFTVLEAAGWSPTLVLNQNAKTKDSGSWDLFKMQMLYFQGAAAQGFSPNLWKASNLPVSKLRRFLHSKFL